MRAVRSIRLVNRNLEVRLSTAAHAAHPDALCASLDERIMACFRPVMTRKCALSDVEGRSELEGFPIQRPEAFLPKWLALDFRRGAWSGEFSF